MAASVLGEWNPKGALQKQKNMHATQNRQRVTQMITFRVLGNDKSIVGTAYSGFESYFKRIWAAPNPQIHP